MALAADTISLLRKIISFVIPQPRHHLKAANSYLVKGRAPNQQSKRGKDVKLNALNTHYTHTLQSN